MKRSISSFNRCLDVVHEVRKVIALVMVAPLCMSALVAQASEGQLSFTGHISNASCAVLQSTNAQERANTQRVKVSEHLSIVVDTAHNACAASVIPFSAQYQALPVVLSSHYSAGSGILTLTYQ